MFDLEELEERGWTGVRGIFSASAMLDLAKSLGTPRCAPNGELIKRVTIKSSAVAKAGTLSAAFGTKGFPLRTDTAFWSIPARYLVLRVYGEHPKVHDGLAIPKYPPKIEE
jgi:hypothetical protein